MLKGVVGPPGIRYTSFCFPRLSAATALIIPFLEVRLCGLTSDRGIFRHEESQTGCSRSGKNPPSSDPKEPLRT